MGETIRFGKDFTVNADDFIAAMAKQGFAPEHWQAFHVLTSFAGERGGDDVTRAFKVLHTTLTKYDALSGSDNRKELDTNG